MSLNSIGGYYRMVEALSDPEHPDYEMYSEWLGIEVYNPEKFDKKKINQRLGHE